MLFSYTQKQATIEKVGKKNTILHRLIIKMQNLQQEKQHISDSEQNKYQIISKNEQTTPNQLSEQNNENIGQPISIETTQLNANDTSTQNSSYTSYYSQVTQVHYHIQYTTTTKKVQTKTIKSKSKFHQIQSNQ